MAAFPATGGCDLFPRARCRRSTHRECRGVGFIALFSAASRTAKLSYTCSWSGFLEMLVKSGGPNVTVCCVSGSDRRMNVLVHQPRVSTSHPGTAQKSKSIPLLSLTPFPRQSDSSPSEAAVCLLAQLNSPWFGKLSTPAPRRLDSC